MSMLRTPDDIIVKDLDRRHEKRFGCGKLELHNNYHMGHEVNTCNVMIVVWMMSHTQHELT